MKVAARPPGALWDSVGAMAVQKSAIRAEFLAMEKELDRLINAHVDPAPPEDK